MCCQKIIEKYLLDNLKCMKRVNEINKNQYMNSCFALETFLMNVHDVTINTCINFY